MFEKSVIVRQVPFTEMESPRAASERMVGQEVMVREVPVAPEALASREFNSLTTVENVSGYSVRRLLDMQSSTSACGKEDLTHCRLSQQVQ